jgi:hypothetical protein
MGFVLDVAGYGARTAPGRDDVQRRLRQLVVAVLAACGLALGAWGVDHQWTGDGINVILPADIDPTVVLSVLIRSLAAALGLDNERNRDRLRLRLAIGVGLAERGPAGFGGPLIVEMNRLVDSAALRSALTEEPAADLAAAVSDQAHALIIQPGYPGIPSGQFHPVRAASKEFSGAAWIWVSTRQWSEPAYRPLRVSDPREIGGYRVAARLGSSVYVASSADAGWAAVKLFDQGLLADADARGRLAAGREAAATVREPHLAPVIGVGRASQGSTWVASTLVPGPSLADAVTETGPLPGATAGWVALGLASALATLHEAGLAHHAVSAGNVLLGASGPVLTDFGISRPALLSGPASLSGPDGAAEDVHQLGRTTFFAVAGRAVAPGDVGPGDVGPGAPELAGGPPWLVPILRACLAPDPARRPTAARLYQWLAEAAGPQPRTWLPGPVAARVAEHQALPPLRGRFRWPRPRAPYPWATSRE